jgi:plasmid stabilization system protein ParE
VPAKYRVEITSTAESDIEGIWIHIAADSAENAARFVMDLEKRIGTLERVPNRCPAIPENELLGTEYRHFVLGDYRVIFRVAAATVYVLRVVHGNRLLDISFFDEPKRSA